MTIYIGNKPKRNIAQQVAKNQYDIEQLKKAAMATTYIEDAEVLESGKLLELTRWDSDTRTESTIQFRGGGGTGDVTKAYVDQQDTLLSAAIDSESNIRESADTALQNAVDLKASTTSLNEEITNRIEADEALESGLSKCVTLDTVQEITGNKSFNCKVTIPTNTTFTADTKGIYFDDGVVAVGETLINGNKEYIFGLGATTGSAINLGGNAPYIKVGSHILGTRPANITFEATNRPKYQNESGITTIALTSDLTPLATKDYVDQQDTNLGTQIATKSVVSGTGDTTNWSTITIDGVTKSIPGGSGGEPATYLKSAAVSGNTLTLTNKDNSTVVYTPDLSGDYLPLTGGTMTGDINMSINNKIKLGNQNEGYGIVDKTGKSLFRSNNAYMVIGSNAADANITNIELRTKNSGSNIAIAPSSIVQSVNGTDGYVTLRAPHVYRQDNSTSDTKELATVDQIPSLTGYATEAWVEGKGYLTEHQSLANYSTTTQMNTAISNHHDSTKADASKYTLQTTAPTAAITDGGIHIVVLPSEPATKYNGYIYLIG